MFIGISEYGARAFDIQGTCTCMRLIFGKRDFDTVIILDACRHDYYCRFRNAEKICAAATQTVPAIERMFPFRYSKTVYVSGNPFINGRHVVFDRYDALDHFTFVDDVWLHGWENIEGIYTVPPWNILEAAAKHQKRGCRIVIHFVQPHAPYIGKIKFGTNDFLWSRNLIMNKGDRISDNIESLKGHRIDVERLREAYCSNLSLALKYALRCVNGKTFITSDHGELLGEDGLFHHGTIEKPLNHPKLWEIPLEILT